MTNGSGGKDVTIGLIAYFLIFIVLNMWLLFETVSTKLPESVSQDTELEYKFLSGLFTIKTAVYKHLTLLVLLGGSLGGLIYGLALIIENITSDQKFNFKQILWQITRPFLGAALAMAIYFAFRGGILATTSIDILNPYGVVTVAIVTGIAAENVVKKLRKIIDVILPV